MDYSRIFPCLLHSCTMALKIETLPPQEFGDLVGPFVRTVGEFYRHTHERYSFICLDNGVLIVWELMEKPKSNKILIPLAGI